MRESPFYIKAHDKRKDYERYSDRYQQNSTENQINIGISSDTSLNVINRLLLLDLYWCKVTNCCACSDWKRYPHELKIRSKKPLAKRSIKPNVQRNPSKDVAKQLEVQVLV